MNEETDYSIQMPKNRISKDFIKVKIISEILSTIITLIVIGVLFYLDHHFAWKEWIHYCLIGILIIVILVSIWSICMSPFLLYKNWRYHADEDFLQVKSGALNEEHQLVPMTKIQSVETNQGPLLRRYSLYSLTIETMGSTHHIPSLPKEVAIDLRNQIAQFAKIKEVEE